MTGVEPAYRTFGGCCSSFELHGHVEPAQVRLPYLGLALGVTSARRIKTVLRETRETP